MSTGPRFSASFRRFLLFSLALSPALHLYAQTSPEEVRQKLEKQYPLTKTTAGKDDIVTAGAVLVLEKDGLVMSTVASNAEAKDDYKGGKITPSFATRMAGGTGKVCSFCPHTDKLPTMRTFVAGEKFWITSIDMKDDGVILNFFSDPISDVRYISQLKFPYTKGASADELMARVAEVIKVQPSDDAKAEPANPAAAAAPAPAMQAIPPPPPPPDALPAAPKTISIGQTKDQVVAIFGPPAKVIKLAAKEIDTWPDMKVTFVKDKVTDIQ